MIEVELTLPDDGVIRTAMVNEAKAIGYELGRSELAELQTLAGRNPMLARKVVRRAKLGSGSNPRTYAVCGDDAGDYCDVVCVCGGAVCGDGDE